MATQEIKTNNMTHEEFKNLLREKLEELYPSHLRDTRPYLLLKHLAEQEPDDLIKYYYHVTNNGNKDIQGITIRPNYYSLEKGVNIMMENRIGNFLEDIGIVFHKLPIRGSMCTRRLHIALNY